MGTLKTSICCEITTKNPRSMDVLDRGMLIL